MNFENMWDKVMDKAQVVGEKTEDMVELSRLKMKASGIKSDIKDKYAQMGKAAYDMHKEKLDGTDLMCKYVTEVDLLLAQLAEVEREIAGATGTNQKLCPECYELNMGKAVFCTRCGQKF